MNLTHDAELLRVWPLLCAAARGEPETWQPHLLESGWKVSVLYQGRGRLALRFRALRAPSLEWVEFLSECSRLVRTLGVSGWRMTESDRKSFFEVSFTAPAEPAISGSGV